MEKKPDSDATVISEESKKEVSASLNLVKTSFALLPICSVYINDRVGQKQVLRVMFDSGSESTFVSESCIKIWYLKGKMLDFR